jgi:hypothetical protein
VEPPELLEPPERPEKHVKFSSKEICHDFLEDQHSTGASNMSRPAEVTFVAPPMQRPKAMGPSGHPAPLPWATSFEPLGKQPAQNASIRSPVGSPARRIESSPVLTRSSLSSGPLPVVGASQFGILGSQTFDLHGSRSGVLSPPRSPRLATGPLVSGTSTALSSSVSALQQPQLVTQQQHQPMAAIPPVPSVPPLLGTTAGSAIAQPQQQEVYRSFY